MGVRVVYNQTYDLLTNSKAAIVTSGTASLECALFKVPQIVCYKTSFISYFIGRTFIKIDFISLVNIILKQKVVQELIQNQLTEKELINEFNEIINGQKKLEMLKHYSKIYSMLSLDKTSNNIANSIIKSKYLIIQFHVQLGLIYANAKYPHKCFLCFFLFSSSSSHMLLKCLPKRQQGLSHVEVNIYI